jgi:hypothetical protein
VRTIITITNIMIGITMKIVLTMIGMKSIGTTITTVFGVAHVTIGPFGITTTSLSSSGPANDGRYLRKRTYAEAVRRLPR